MNTDKLVSFYQHPFESDNGHDYHTNIKTIFEFIKSGKYAIPHELATEIESRSDNNPEFVLQDFGKIVMQYQNALLTDPEAKQETTQKIKLSLPAFIPSGTFPKGKKKENLDKRSNYIAIDIDWEKQDKDWDCKATKQAMIQYAGYFRIIAISPSGKGLKCIVEHEEYDDHEAIFNAIKTDIENKFKVIVDPSGKNINRLCFLPFDQSAWYHEIPHGWFGGKDPRPVFNMPKLEPKEIILEPLKPKPKSPQAVDMRLFNSMMQWLESECVDITAEYHHWQNIAFALANSFGENGREYFHKISRHHHEYDTTKTNAKYDDALKSQRGAVSIASVILFAKEKGFNTRTPSIQHVGEFYEITKHGKVTLNEMRMYQIFKENGVCFFQFGNDKPILVRISENVCKVIDSEELRRMITQHINELNEEYDIKESLHNAVSKNSRERFGETKWHHFFTTIIDPQFMHDEPTVNYQYFKNGFVRITKDTRELIPYRNAPGLVWESWFTHHHAKSHNVRIMHPEDYRSSDWYKLFQLLCTNKETGELDEKRFLAFRWSNGLLCHNPKTTADRFLIHFCEDNIQWGHHGGGTCKTQVTKGGLEKLREVAMLKAKEAIGDKFAYQHVSHSTQIIHYGDVNLEFLQGKFMQENYENITDHLRIERKNQRVTFIPGEKLPRFVSTGNGVPSTKDTSARRRIYIMEIFSHFNDKYTPDMHFGRRFFDTWNGDEWSAFYNTYFECIQTLLQFNDMRALHNAKHDEKIKFPEYQSETLALNQFRTNTHPDWETFIMLCVKDNLELSEVEHENIQTLKNSFSMRYDSETQKVVMAIGSDDLFKLFKNWGSTIGSDVRNVRHQDISQWLQLTPAMLNDKMQSGWYWSNQTSWHYESIKSSYHDGKRIHMIIAKKSPTEKAP